MTYSTQGGSNNGPIVTPGGIGGGGSSGFAPLVANVEYWVDSATGNDANSGAMATPWATLQRALDERAKYGELRAEFLIHLVGAGPYSMNRFEGSFAGENGRFEIRGDVTANTVHVSSTFTGGFAGTGVVPVTAGLGNDTQGRRFLRVTSGTLIGAEFTIVDNTDASITVASNYTGITAALGDVANGDTFDIYTPGTVIDLPAVDALSSAPKPGFSDLTGSGAFRFAGYLAEAKHWLRALTLRAINAPTNATINFVRSVIGFSSVYIDSPSQFFLDCDLQFGVTDDAFGVGASLVYAAGLRLNNTYVTYLDGTSLGCGILSTQGVFYVGYQTKQAALFHSGGRIGTINTGGAYYRRSYPSTQADLVVGAAIWASGGGRVQFENHTLLRMTTNNYPLRILNDGQIYIGTADMYVVPFGNNPLISIDRSGHVYFSVVPTHFTPTGAGSDVRIPNVPDQPVSVLTANSSIFDAISGARVYVS